MFRYIVLFLIISASLRLPAQQIKSDSSQVYEVSEFADTNESKKTGAKIKFTITSHELDTIQIGTKLTYEFEFSNTGNQPLLITNVRTSCNCTVASYPETPVLSEKTEKIILSLDTHKKGSFAKVVAVYSNAINLPRVILNIKWHVASDS